MQIDGATNNRLFVLLLGNGMVSFGGWIDYIVILTVSVYTWEADQYDVAFIGAATLLPGSFCLSQLECWSIAII